MIKKTHIN